MANKVQKLTQNLSQKEVEQLKKLLKKTGWIKLLKMKVGNGDSKS